MKYLIILLAMCLSFCACEKNEKTDPIVEPTPVVESDKISAVDISSFPEIEMSNPIFYKQTGEQAEFLSILKDNGVNTIRLRLWVNPENEHSGFNEVKAFSQRVKNQGFKVWLTVHYSDTWADPGNQKTPTVWSGINFLSLKDSVQVYTKKVVEEMNPDYIQIGNEINSGLLHPAGNIGDNLQQFKDLITAATKEVRLNNSDTKIILHYAGLSNAEWFFDQLSGLDYDIIGLSYYPIWHGKDLSELRTKMQELSETNNKDIVLAEIAYPFTLDWNDWTNNIIGLHEQLIPSFQATAEGQRAYIGAIKAIVLDDVSKGLGFCYWGAELIAWKGDEAVDASPWENQALFDFENKALPVLEEFKVE